MQRESNTVQENNPKTHQILVDNHSWCCQTSGAIHDMPHLFTDILDLNSPDVFKQTDDYENKRRKILGSRITTHAPCAMHSGNLGGCEIPGADFGVSGLPCTDMSMAGKRRFRHGPTNAVFMTHGKYTEAHKIPIFIIECTPVPWLTETFCVSNLLTRRTPPYVHYLWPKDLDMYMLEDVHPNYDFYQLFFETSFTGHGGAARTRTYVIGSRCDVSSCRSDPFEVQQFIVKETGKFQTRPSDYCLADMLEIQMEAMHVANVRRLDWTPPATGSELDLRGLLLPREKQALAVYEQKYMEKYGGVAATDRDLVFFLGDNPDVRCTWSASSGSLPTQRLNARTGKYWLPSLRRWLVARERLAAMGWPVTEELAKAMQCPVVPTRDVLRSALLSGNAMHFNTVALAQLIALACFGPIS